MVIRKYGRQVVRVAFASLLAAGCGKKDKSDSESTPDPDEPYTAVEGDEATKYFANAAFDVAPMDPDSLSKALALSEDAEAADLEALAATTDGASLDDGGNHVFETDAATLKFLKTGAHAKETIQTANIPLPAINSLASLPAEKLESAGFALTDPPVVPETINTKTDTVKLDDASWGSKSEFKIPHVTDIPVKDQGDRGTCAAHAGIGYLEYAIIKKYGSRLSSIDLSEQRFYMMSKQDLWKTGGVVDADGGSAWANGYSMSLGNAGVTVPSDNTTYNIPLETDCPYNKGKGKNELQIAQAAKCKKGTVKVTSLSETYWQTTGGSTNKVWHSNAVRSAQEIFNYLTTKGLPVPTATELTDAWIKNDGMITLAKSKNQPTQGGHAYLIVGARKLDEKKFPKEGGMCFIIKNSWGLGWGQNGYSCMTLAWFNNFRRPEFYDIAFDVNLDVDTVAPLKSKAPPAAVKKGVKLQEDEGGDEGLPVLVNLPAKTDNPGLDQEAAADTAAPVPDEAPGVTDDGYTVTGLVDATGNVVKALYKVTGANIEVRGVLKGEAEVSQALTLGFDAGTSQLVFTDAKRGAKVVGELKDGKLNICSQAFSEVCQLNYVAADKRLVLGLTEAEFHNYTPDPKADYKTLVSFEGYAIQFVLASASFADFRLVLAGTPTNALRLKTDALSGSIQYKGKEVGNYQKLGLCSGDYKKVCSLVVNSEDKTLNIFFKMQ